MDEETHYSYIRDTVKLLLNVKLVIGCILLLAGGYLAIQIISISLNIIIHPEKIIFLEFLKKIEPDGVYFGGENGKFFISNTFFSYTIIIFVLLISASIVKKIISFGVDLIKVDIKFLLEKLWKEWDELRLERKQNKNKSY